MALTFHDVVLETTEPDGLTPLDMLWAVRVLTEGGTLIDTAAGVVLLSTREQATTGGVTTFTLPAIPQDDIEPSDATYQLSGRPLDSRRGGSITTEPFQLTADRTLANLHLESGAPITPSTLAAALAAQAAAEAAAAAAQASAEVVGAFVPENYGAVGNGTTDDSEAVQGAMAAASAASALYKMARVVLTQTYRITTNLYAYGNVIIEGPGELYLDPAASPYEPYEEFDTEVTGGPWITEQDSYKYWINLGVSAKGVNAALWAGRWSGNIRTSDTVFPTDLKWDDDLGKWVVTPTGMRLINAHRFADASFENFTIDMRESGPCKVSGIGCYSDGAWGTATKTRLTVRGVNVLAAQSATLGGEGIGFGSVTDAWVENNYVHGVGDDPIGVHAGCINVEVFENHCYSVDGRIYFSSSAGVNVHHNHVERIANPDDTWASGGAMIMCEIENVNAVAPSDINIHHNRVVHGAGIATGTYGIRTRGIRRGAIHDNDIYDAAGPGYGVTWEGDGDPIGWSDPEGLDGWVQVVRQTNSPTGGTFTLSYDGETTAAIAHDASSTAVRTALEALSTIGVGNVTVNANGPDRYTITLGTAITDPEPMTATSSLTGAGDTPDVTVGIGARVRDLTVRNNRYFGPANGRGDGRIRESVGFTGALVGPITLHGNQQGPRWSNAATLTLTGSPTGGTFTLTYSGQTTAAIDYDATEEELVAALEALSNIGVGDVTVIASLTTASAWVLAFAPGYSLTNTLSGSAAGLTGGTSPTVKVSPRTAFSASSATAYTTASFPVGISLPLRSSTGVVYNDFFTDSEDGRPKYTDITGTAVPLMLNRSTTKLTATTVSNATSGTLWTDTTIAADVLRAGMALRIVLPLAFASIASSGTFEIQHMINGVLVGTGRMINVSQTAAIAGSSSTAKIKQLVDIWVEATGASGVVSASINGVTRSNAGGTAVTEESQTLATTVDLSAGLTYSAVAVMSTANAGNTITLQRAVRTIVA